eukprot:TRINITY_DN14399_c0_g3_i1.p1 TRINITY_DN14399_c0_g3~~TRINITY_DN14399_c0_g3_i1.p1  ORF type:complete len:222 (-),score=55.93 TRINITY_DN14399_c0_g3_i1:158-823(-)
MCQISATAMAAEPTSEDTDEDGSTLAAKLAVAAHDHECLSTASTCPPDSEKICAAPRDSPKVTRSSFADGTAAAPAQPISRARDVGSGGSALRVALATEMLLRTSLQKKNVLLCEAMGRFEESEARALLAEEAMVHRERRQTQLLREELANSQRKCAAFEEQAEAASSRSADLKEALLMSVCELDAARRQGEAAMQNLQRSEGAAGDAVSLLRGMKNEGRW